MKEKIGQVFSIAKDNPPIEGCTISKEIDNGIIYFSLAKDTDISAETYPYNKILIISKGSLYVYTDKKSQKLNLGDCIITDVGTPIGIKTEESTIYTELTIKEANMNKSIKTGEVFKFADLVPYQEGKIVNMDIVSNQKMKFVVMSFDEGTGLSEHSAPGEALIFALDGEGIIGYEGKEHKIQAGENFHFAKNGLHYVKATKKFKMALLLTLE